MKEKKLLKKTNKSTEKKTAVAEMLLDEELLKTVSGGDIPTIHNTRPNPTPIISSPKPPR